MGTLRIHFTVEDICRTTVAAQPDPMWEIVGSLHRLQTRAGYAAFADWHVRVRQDLAQANLGSLLGSTLLPLVPRAEYFPDFLTPSGGPDGIDASIDRVLSTPKIRLRHDLNALADTGRAMPSCASALAAGHPAALTWLGSALRRYYDVAVRPYWSDVARVATTERVVQSSVMVNEGVGGLLSGLSPLIVWEPPVLRVTYVSDWDLFLRGRGLALIPSYFSWGTPVALADPKLPPILVYPAARRETTSTQRRAVKLLGATRHAVLGTTMSGATTTEIARRVGISPATASYHTSVLAEAGLVLSRRDANMVVHHTTPLGERMLGYQPSDQRVADLDDMGRPRPSITAVGSP